MQLTDTQIQRFDTQVLKLDPDKRKEYREQVDHLIGRLEKKIEEDSSFDVRRFFKAGSLRKGTALRPRDGFRVDADIAAYLETEDTSEFNLDTLHSEIRRLLIAIYPTKKPEDFTVEPKTLGIRFEESGLDVDLVPVVALPGPGDYGLQPSSRGEPPVKTSIPKQLQFFENRRARDPRHRRVVRLLKRWRNQQELEALRSFAIELIASHLLDRDGPASSVEAALLRFFLWVAQTELAEPISFSENGRVKSWPTDPVVLLDPVNTKNNVTRRITDYERKEIVTKALEAWEVLTTARRNGYKGETIEYWREVFGRSFTIEE